MDRLYWPITIILIIITVWLFFPSNSPVQPDDAGTFASSHTQFAGDAVTDVCGTHDAIEMHYHANLFLFINGTEQEVPPNIGIPSEDCMQYLHTHEPNGNIHIELPEDYSGNTPTLNDFFSIWGYNFNSTTLLNQTGEVSITINDQNIDLSDKIPEGYRFANDDVIEISLD